MRDILFESAIIIALILLNGLFSLAEMAVITAKRLRLEDDAEAGDIGAKAALKLSRSPNTFLSTVQIGITLVGIVAGVYGGASLAEQLAVILSEIPSLTKQATPIAFIIVVMAITFLSLVLGELIPKRIALSYPEQIAKIVSPPMTFLAKICSPLVWLLDQCTSFVLSIFGVKPRDAHTITEDDIRSMVEQGSEEGVIDEAEGQIVSKVFRLGDRSAGSIMTPRNDLVWLNTDNSLKENWQKASESTHSNYPVARGGIENVVGVVTYKDLAELIIHSDGRGLDSITMEPLRIPTNINALQVLDLFRLKKVHLALVFDEHGNLNGMITLHDILEAMVGSIALDGETEWIQRADGSYLVDAAIDLVDLFEMLGLEESEKDVAPGYHSLGGFIFHQLGHIPKEGEACDFSKFRFEVVDMDGMRIDKVLIQRITTNNPQESEAA